VLTGTSLLNAVKIVPSAHGKPKLPQIEHVYSSMYYATKIKPLAKARWAVDKGKDGPKGKPLTQVASNQVFTKEMWESESVEVQAAVEKERQARFTKSMENYEKAQAVGSKTPEEFQKCVFSFLFPDVITQHRSNLLQCH
jgi:hypothetical protein